MTVNGLMAVIFRYSAKFSSFGTNYVKAVEDDHTVGNEKCSAKNLAFKHYMSYADIRRDYRERVH